MSEADGSKARGLPPLGPAPSSPTPAPSAATSAQLFPIAPEDMLHFSLPMCEYCGLDLFTCTCDEGALLDDDDDGPFITFIYLERLRDMRALQDHIVIIDIFSALYDTSPTGDADGDESRAIDLFTALHPIKSRDSHTPIVLLSMMGENEYFIELWKEHGYEPILFITGCGVNVNDLAKCNLERARSVVIMASGEASSARADEISLMVALSVRQAVGARNIPILTDIESLDALYSFPPHYSNEVCYDTATTIATGEDPRARNHFAFAASVLTGSVLSTQMLDAAIFHNYFNPYMLKVIEALVGGSVTNYVKRRRGGEEGGGGGGDGGGGVGGPNSSVLGRAGGAVDGLAGTSMAFEEEAFDPSAAPTPSTARRRNTSTVSGSSLSRRGGGKQQQPSSTLSAEEEEGVVFQAVVGLSSMPNSRDDPFGRTYLDAVSKFAAEGVVVLGIYRVVRDERHGDLNGRRVMITNPPPRTTLLYEDIIYYISK